MHECRPTDTRLLLLTGFRGIALDVHPLVRRDGVGGGGHRVGSTIGVVVVMVMGVVEVRGDVGQVIGSAVQGTAS